LSEAITLRSRGITFRYPGSRDVVLADIDFELAAGAIVALTGPIGVGKTTLGMILKGLLEPQGGRVVKAEGSLERPLSVRERVALVGWCPARPERSIFAATVADEVAFGPINIGLERPVVELRVSQALTQMGLTPSDYRHRHPLELSGGEKRRVALAGIIAMEPAFLILDDPPAGLDDEGVEQLSGIVGQQAKAGRGVLLIGHDGEFYTRVGAKILRLESGGHICSITTSPDLLK